MAYHSNHLCGGTRVLVLTLRKTRDLAKIAANPTSVALTIVSLLMYLCVETGNTWCKLVSIAFMIPWFSVFVFVIGIFAVGIFAVGIIIGVLGLLGVLLLGIWLLGKTILIFVP